MDYQKKYLKYKAKYMEALKEERSLMQRGGVDELNIGNNQLPILLDILMGCKKAFIFKGSNITVEVNGWIGKYEVKFNITEDDTDESPEKILQFIKGKLPSGKVSSGEHYLAQLAIELNKQSQGINWIPTEPSILKVNNRHSYSIDENNENINISSTDMRGNVLKKQVAIADERYVEADASTKHKLKKAVEDAIRITSTTRLSADEAGKIAFQGIRVAPESRKTLEEQEADKERRKNDYRQALDKDRIRSAPELQEINTNLEECRSREYKLDQDRIGLFMDISALGEGYNGCLKAHSKRNEAMCKKNGCVWDGDNCNNSWRGTFTSSNKPYVAAQQQIRDIDNQIAESKNQHVLANKAYNNFYINQNIRREDLRRFYRLEAADLNF